MTDNKYEKLDRMRNDIRRDKEKEKRLHQQILRKEEKLREAEATQIVADVGELKLTPEQLGEFLKLIKSGQMGLPGAGSSQARENGPEKDAGSEEDPKDWLDDDGEEREENGEDEEG